jgi:type II secretory pathway pseudopilin PulG
MSTLAGQQTIIDVSVFEQVIDAYAAGDRELEDFYRERAREEFRPALEAWIALARDDLESAPSTPFAMAEYVLAADLRSERLQREAESAFQVALDDNQRSDNYVLLAVLFASVLLFAGLAPKSRSYQIQVTMIALAVVVLMIGIALLLAFPKTF